MTDSQIIVFGVGSMSELVTAFLEKESYYTITAYCVEKKFKDGLSEFNRRPVVDFESLPERYPSSNFKLFIAVGNNYTRERIFRLSKENGYSMISHISSSVIHWDDLEYGENVLISGSSTLQPLVKIMDNTFVMGSKIGHHTVVGKHVLLSCTTLGGNVRIDDYSFLGLNSAVHQNTIVSEKNIIGMGCSIVQSTNAKEVYTASACTVKRNISSDKIKFKYM